MGASDNALEKPQTLCVVSDTSLAYRFGGESRFQPVVRQWFGLLSVAVTAQLRLTMDIESLSDNQIEL